MSISKAIDRSHGIVLYGTLYLSNDSSTYDSQTCDLVNNVMRLMQAFETIETYEEKLDIWFNEALFITEIWIGDTSRIVERENAFNYTGQLRPEPDYLLTIIPSNQLQILELNIRNIKSCVERIGSFEQYEQQYLQHLKDHADSPLYDRKLVADLQQAESELSHYHGASGVRGWYGISVNAWYNSFTNQHDTLTKKDYQIWENLDQLLSNLPLLSSNKRTETPYLLNLIDRPNDVIQAAKAYVLRFKIPFLRTLREERLKRALAANLGHLRPSNRKTALTSTAETESETGSIDTETLTETSVSKVSKKKAKQITTKQQLILLHKLGFPAALTKLTTQHQAVILAQLLFRNEQEIRVMLTNWGNVNAPKDYNCTLPDDLEKVIDLLEDNNLQI